jgi:hypothetical protein
MENSGSHMTLPTTWQSRRWEWQRKGENELHTSLTICSVNHHAIQAASNMFTNLANSPNSTRPINQYRVRVDCRKVFFCPRETGIAFGQFFSPCLLRDTHTILLLHKTTEKEVRRAIQQALTRRRRRHLARDTLNEIGRSRFYIHCMHGYFSIS